MPSHIGWSRIWKRSPRGTPRTNLPCCSLSRYTGYNEKGERLVAGVVPLNANKDMVLLIQSTKRKAWVLPKGGWEKDEDVTEAAVREAWEEAGIVIQIESNLGHVREGRKAKDKDKATGKEKERAYYQFFEAIVVTEEDEWPEKAKRMRAWFTFAEAKKQLESRPELLHALEVSSLQRPKK